VSRHGRGHATHAIGLIVETRAQLVTIDMGRKEGELLCPFRAELGPPTNTMWPSWTDVYFRTKWRLHPSSRLATIDLDPSSHLATIDMGQKLGGVGVPFFSGGSWVPVEHKVS